MRIAVCALSAVLLSGCSWLGMGGHGSSSNGHSGYYGADCGGQGGYGYQGGYGAGDGCGPAGGYAVGGQAGHGAGYGAYGAGQGAGYGAGAGYGSGVSGFQGAYGGAAGYGQAGYGQGGMAGYGQAGYGGYGAGGTTMLAANAPYGAGVGGNIVASQYGNGQVVAGGVQTIQGAPIYVNQPYPVPCAYGQNCGPQLRGTGRAMPFGLELHGGTEFDIGGDIFTAKDPGLALGSTTVNTGGSNGISYDDAFGQMKTIGGTLGYDISRNTTVLGGVSYSKANGQTAERYQSVDARSPGTLEDIDATFSDLDLWTIEGGVRHYMGGSGHGGGFRPYVGASAGFTHNKDVSVQRTYTSDGAAYDAEPFEYADAGWEPTAAGVIGAEMAVGNRAALGVETGIRWRDQMDTISESEDRWSIPVQLRGRVSF